MSRPLRMHIDEAALREGLPLRRHEQPGYLDWAVAAFRLTASRVRDETQIHKPDDAVAVQQNVGRLDVSMNQPGRMRMFECICDLADVVGGRH